MKFLSCFPKTDRLESDQRYAPVSSSLDDTKMVEKGCVFCGISKEKGFDILHEDDELIVFRDRWPRAKEHLLIVPRYHVASTVRDLRPIHIPLIRRMHALCFTLYPDLTSSSSSSSNIKIGFHIPPFSSVHHLHMHVLVPPFTTMGRVQYPVSKGKERKGKGWSWFVTPNQALDILEYGDVIGIGSSSNSRNGLN